MRKALQEKLNEWSRWDSLRQLGSSALVRSSLVFAVAGYVLLWNVKVQDFLTIRLDNQVTLWRIWMIYYGGIAIAIATALYSSFCPKPIKESGSAFELGQRESGHLLAMGLGSQYLVNVKRLEARCNTAERALWPPDRPRENVVAAVNSVGNGREILASLIVYAWRVHNIRYPRLRLIILVFYCAGFGLLAVPAAVTFVQVTTAGLRILF
jgi:hypothetical protein